MPTMRQPRRSATHRSSSVTIPTSRPPLTTDAHAEVTRQSVRGRHAHPAPGFPITGPTRIGVNSRPTAVCAWTTGHPQVDTLGPLGLFLVRIVVVGLSSFLPPLSLPLLHADTVSNADNAAATTKRGPPFFFRDDPDISTSIDDRRTRGSYQTECSGPACTPSTRTFRSLDRTASNDTLSP